MKNHNVTANQVSLPKGGGAIQGIGETFQADDFTGTASLSIPISVSPCRGWEPTLTLEYSSGTGNGVFGLGFSLSVPSISRQTSKGTPRYDKSDTFLFSGTDYLVPALKDDGQIQQDNKSLQKISYTVTTYRPRVEQAFLKIEYWQNPQDSTDAFWRVIDTDNTLHLFGKTPEARIVDPADASRIFEWLLEETLDSKGNCQLYRYKAENTDGIESNTIGKQNRSQTANKYIDRIYYGNPQPITQPLSFPSSDKEVMEGKWHFEVVFDYGEYNVDPGNPNPYEPTSSWRDRPDPFSSYQAGFEILTHRLCRHILMFHRFEELAENPVLVHATRFHYRESPVLTLLTAVEQIGYQYRPEQPYAIQCLPPLEFDYTAFNPLGHNFEPLEDDQGNPLPGLDGTANHTLVDLYGEGIPGLLYSDGLSTYYRSPELSDTNGGNGKEKKTSIRYGPIEQPQTLPIHQLQADATHTLMDLTGNGRMDWVVSTPGCSGYYEAMCDRTWLNFQLFERFPNDFLNPDNHLVDVTGDGLPDCLLVGTQTVRVYPNNRQQGFGSPIEQVRQSTLPASLQDTPTTLITFADLLGDGKQHLVRISYNKVECWPNQGYGRFGDPILLANPPQFEPEQFRSDRLFLADLDGSGTADLIYIYQDKAVIYLNQSGNRFGDPIEIQLPDAFDQLDQISFADVYGTGASCLIFSETHPTPRDWCYDFTQQQKPYLLNRIYNNLGAQTTFYYRSSTGFYLEAKKQGKPWITNLPFPVQVLERIEYKDFISGSTLVSQFCYHHGYYDGVEREFRGFGLVERQDTETSTDAQGKDPHYVAPALSKTWYHTGSEHQDTLTHQYEKEYYQDDLQAALLPDSTVDWGQGGSDAEAMREAQRALKGSILRTEVYGLDESEPKQHPYSVVETNYYVQLLQPKQNNRYSIFYLHPRETLTYDYERNPADPRFSHDFILKVDEYGNVLQSCHIAYGRRSSVVDPVMQQLDASERQKIGEEQQQLKAVCTIARYINQTGDDIYLLGIPKENQTYEIKNLLTPDSQEILSFDRLAKLLSAFDPNAGSPFSKDTQVQLIEWERHFYTSPAQNDPLKFGEVTSPVLPSHTEIVVFSQEEIQQAPNEFQAQMEPGKYQNHDGYWWNPNLQETYYDVSQFCLPKATKDPFGNQTTYEYDCHYLILVKTTDALNNQVLAQDINYEVLHPQKLVDINSNSSEIHFDPIGRVIVTSHYGTENGQPVGFDRLSNYNPQQATSVDDIINDPQKYLQNTADYFYYDLFCWMGQIEQNDFSQLSLSDENLQKLWDELIDKSYINRQGAIFQRVRELSDANQLQLSDAFAQQKTNIFNILKQAPQCQPVHAIQLTAENYPQAVSRLIQINITYSDGFDRILQQKVKVEPGDAFIVDSQGQLQNDGQQEHTENRWLTSGRKVYNNKGNPVQQYEPYFINTPEFIDNATLNSFGVTPILYYDPLQRVTHIETAKGFLIKTEWTPWSETHYDENDTIKDSPYYQANIRNRDSSSPYDDATLTPEEKQALEKAAQFYNTPDRKILDNLGRTIRDIQQKEDRTQLITYYEWDIQGHLLSSADPRLGANGIKNFQYTYGLTGKRLKTESVDAGIRWSLSNVMGRPIYGQDGRETQVFFDYDQLHRPITIRVQLKGGSSQTVERLVYGESLDEQTSKNVNRRGQVYQHYDQAGLLQIDSYSILGNALSISQGFTKDYRNTVDWPKNSQNWNSLLQEKSYQYRYQYDGLGRVSQQTDPDGNVHIPEYHLSGLLNKVSVAPSEEQAPVDYVKAIKYNARGQRLQVDYGNQTSTKYTYDSKTFRLDQILTSQTQASKTLQDLKYTFDPVGNVAHIKDNASAAVLGDKSGGSWDCDYTYDVLYQLTQATGRESALSPDQTLSLPLSGNQRLRDYTRTFNYDASGNLYQVQHQQKSSRLIGRLLMSVKRLVKRYDKANQTTMTVSAHSNRVVSSQLAAKPEEVEGFFDANGNQIQTANLKSIDWNYYNNIQKVNLNGQSVSEFYVYNSAGHRVRKVTEHYTTENKIESTEETLYLGDLEIRRCFVGQSTDNGSNGGSLTGEGAGNGSNGGSLPGQGGGNGSNGEGSLSDFPWLWWWSSLLAIALNLWTSNYYPNFPWVLWLPLSGLLALTFGLVSRFAPRQQNKLSPLERQIDVSQASKEMAKENLPEESHFLKIQDDQRCIATLIYKPNEVSSNPQVRYTLDNHLGSYLLEVDSKGDVLSYEEYYPYGGTALVAGSNLELKHYHYSGKEQDTNTGLYYYGARYYSPELRRWLSPDPAGTVDGLNLYAFVKENPVTLRDREGMKISGETKDERKKQILYKWRTPLNGIKFKNNINEVINIRNRIADIGETIHRKLPDEYKQKNVAVLAYFATLTKTMEFRAAISGRENVQNELPKEYRVTTTNEKEDIYAHNENQTTWNYSVLTKFKLLTHMTQHDWEFRKNNSRNQDSEVHLVHDLIRRKVEFDNKFIFIYSTPHDFCSSCGGGEKVRKNFEKKHTEEQKEKFEQGVLGQFSNSNLALNIRGYIKNKNNPKNPVYKGNWSKGQQSRRKP